MQVKARSLESLRRTKKAQAFQEAVSHDQDYTPQQRLISDPPTAHTNDASVIIINLESLYLRFFKSGRL